MNQIASLLVLQPTISWQAATFVVSVTQVTASLDQGWPLHGQNYQQLPVNVEG